MAKNIEKSKIIVRLKGGLGNQLFQVANVLKHHVETCCVTLDLSSGYYKDPFRRNPSAFFQDSEFSLLYVPRVRIIIIAYLSLLRLRNFSFLKAYDTRVRRQFIEGYGFDPGVARGFEVLRSKIFSNIVLLDRLCVHVRDFKIEGAQGYHTLGDSYYIDAVKMLYEVGLEIVLIGNNSAALMRISELLFLEGVNAEISSGTSAEDDFLSLLKSKHRIYSLSSFSVAAHLILRPYSYVFPPEIYDYVDFKDLQDDL